jgi:hypothetical protein
MIYTQTIIYKSQIPKKLISAHYYPPPPPPSSSSSSSSSSTPLSWVSACSIVEHCQQEDFTEFRCQRYIKPPTWRRTRDLERSTFCHKRPPASEATLANPAAEGGTMGEKWPRILPKVTTNFSTWLLLLMYESFVLSLAI